MKKAKLIFGLLALTIFSLSFVLNNSTTNDAEKNKQEAIKKSSTKGIPTNG